MEHTDKKSALEKISAKILELEEQIEALKKKADASSADVKRELERAAGELDEVDVHRLLGRSLADALDLHGARTTQEVFGVELVGLRGDGFRDVHVRSPFRVRWFVR